VVGVNEEIRLIFENYTGLVDEHFCGITLCSQFNLIMKGIQGDI
jgi:hypothetical protein